jgi:hypothetical protein
MRHLLLVSAIGATVLTMASCGSPSSDSTSTPTNSPPASPIVPSTASPQPTVNPEGTKAAGSNAGGAAVAQLGSGLLPQTDPDVRRQEISSGQRNDPFSSLNFNPEITAPPPLPGSGGSGVSGSSDSGSTSGSGRSSLTGAGTRPGGSRPSSATATRGGKPAATASRLPGNQPNSSAPVAPPVVPPPPPTTDLADAVQVTGVVQLGSIIQAIVKAPNEPSSRNVQPGERLSNGQVLVKEIMLGAGGNPVVVLEQNGVEIMKPLSDKSAKLMG